MKSMAGRKIVICRACIVAGRAGGQRVVSSIEGVDICKFVESSKTTLFCESYVSCP